MDEAVILYLCAGADMCSSINEISVADCSGGSQIRLGVNRVHGLHLAYLMQHLHKRLSEFVVVNRYKRFALPANEFKETVIIRTTQYHNVVQFSIVKLLVVVKKAVNNIPIAFKNFLCRTSQVVGTEDNNRILHSDQNWLVKVCCSWVWRKRSSDPTQESNARVVCQHQQQKETDVADPVLHSGRSGSRS